MTANVSIVFTGGIGDVTVKHKRGATLIQQHSFIASGSFDFDVMSNDRIVAMGDCTADATLTINLKTDPTTPEKFTHNVLGNYIIE